MKGGLTCTVFHEGRQDITEIWNALAQATALKPQLHLGWRYLRGYSSSHLIQARQVSTSTAFGASFSRLWLP
jgi:hypothetical protein